jgi:hypothetical protein
MAFEDPFAEMVRLAPGYRNFVVDGEDGTVGNFA